MIFQYEQGDSWFHKLNPLPKFIWLISISILSIRYEQAGIQALLFIAVMLFGLLACKLSLAAIWRRVRIPLWLSTTYFLLQLLFVPGETKLFAAGWFVITAEALDFAAAITLRLLTLLLATLWFITTTDPRDVVLALVQQLRVPYRYAYGLAVALRFLPILHEEADTTKAAHLRRGRPHGFKNRLAWWRRFVFSVFVSAIRRVQQMAEAMEVRGFGRHHTRTYFRQLKHAPSGILLALFSICMTMIVLILY